MKTAIDEIAPDVFRLSVKEPSKPLGFNHFLIKGQCSALVHLGHARTFTVLRDMVKEIIDLSVLRYLAFSHFEADESGSIAQWLEAAPYAEIVAGKEAISSVSDFVDRRWKILSDGESISVGTQKLTLLETPHVPHNWDACLFYLPKEKILFGSDLATQFGDCPAIADRDVLDKIFLLQEKIGYLSYGPHLTSALKKIKSLEVGMLAVMHGSSLREEQSSRFFERLSQRNSEAMA